MIELTEHRVVMPYLPAALRGLRVVQLSDLHRSPLTSDRLLRHAVAMANAAEPDLIVLTGDFVSENPADIEPCVHMLSPLCARMGLYAILGNHDYNAGWRHVERALTRRGITVLMNKGIRTRDGLWVVGLDDDRYSKPDVARAFEGIGEQEPVLALCHNPACAELLAHRACVVLSGHTHGGQIRLPVFTEREVRRIGAKHYREGWFTVGQARLYVNRGLGKVGFPIRFLCRPEIAVFTVEPSERMKDEG